MKEIAFFSLLWFLFLISAPSAAEEYKLELSEIEKKPYHLGGYGEFRPVFSGLDKSAAFYKLNFYNQNVGSTTADYNFRLQPDLSYEKGIFRLFTRVNFDLTNTYQGWSSDTTLYEGFLSFKPSSSFILDMGKKTLKWGKGYAFNPVAFIDRPKDPNDPELALEGFWVVSLDWIQSFSGPLKTASFTPVLMPVTKHVNDDFGTLEKMNVAGKLYLLLYDTDLDFLVFTGGSRTTRYGIDFSRNITTNFEVHGEFAYVEDFNQITIDQNGRTFSSTSDVVSYLLGVRYLTQRDTTYILEYYRNGTGFTREEMQDFFSFVDNGFNTYLSTGNDSVLKRAQNLTQGNYGRPNPMKDYLYLRVTQKDPFDILYFTPAFTFIWNPRDRSFSAGPELLYTRITNLELRLKAFFPVGKGGTDFGERQYDYRLEFRARYYF